MGKDSSGSYRSDHNEEKGRKMKKLYILIGILLMTSFLFSTRLEVSQDGSCAYTIIQQAINACSTGDTVYVHPGI